MLLLNDTLQVDIDEEIAGFVGHLSVAGLDRNWPQGLNAKQILEVHHVDDFERSRLWIVVNMAMLGIDVQK